MTSASMLKGGLIGGLLGVAVGFLYRPGASEEADTDSSLRSGALAILHNYPHICNDGAIYVSLQEPLPLFMQVDAATLEHFLKDLELFLSEVNGINQGSKKPADVAKVLAARRQANNRLHFLLRRAKQRKPALASEIDEDIQALKKSLDGHIHNSMQQSTLNIIGS